MADSVLDTYALSTLANANSYLGLTSDSGAVDTYVENIINRASDMIEDALHNKIMARLNVKERHDGLGQENIYFDQFPVVAVNLDELAWSSTGKTVTRKDGGSFIIDGFLTSTGGGDKILVQDSDLNSGLFTTSTGSSGVSALYMRFDEAVVDDTVDDNVILSNFRELWIGDNEIDEDDYKVHTDHIYYPIGFSKGHGNVRMTYYGGQAAIPDDVERLCLRLVKQIYDKSEGVKAEKLGPYSVTYANEGNIKDEIRNELTRFANVVV